MFETAGMQEGTVAVASMSEICSAMHEDIRSILKRARQESELALTEMSDSDDESAGGPEEDGTQGSADAATKQEDAAIRYVVIRDTSLKTYKAILNYLCTGHIDFAQVLSSCPRRRDELCSPKTIYRFAHKFQLDDLQQLALAAFGSQLRVSNVLAELFSPAAYLYPELQEVALAATIKLWKGLRISKGSAILDDVLERVQTGATDSSEAAAVAIKLLKRM
jgi:hypothetical protein